MFELLFIFGAVAWLVLTAFEWLSALEAFPTIVAGLVGVPILAVWTYGRLLARLKLDGLWSRRILLPPERFYWPGQARSLRRKAAAMLVGAAVAWSVAISFPAAIHWTLASVVGWVGGALALGLSAGGTARLAIFVRGSQRFDPLTPLAVGALRRWMFWISDNYEFLGEEPEVRRKRERESIY